MGFWWMLDGEVCASHSHIIGIYKFFLTAERTICGRLENIDINKKRPQIYRLDFFFTANFVFIFSLNQVQRVNSKSLNFSYIFFCFHPKHIFADTCVTHKHNVFFKWDGVILLYSDANERAMNSEREMLSY